MSGVSLPLSRPVGRALVVGGSACRAEPLAILARQGVGCDEADDVYAAMATLAHRPMVFRAMVLSLSSLYREELDIIATIKRRYPHMEIWVSQSDGRAAALAESVRLGADALVSGEGIHRIDQSPPPAARAGIGSIRPAASAVSIVQDGGLADPVGRLAGERISDHPGDDNGMGEPVLTADELRALLADQSPVLPQHGEEL